MYEHKLEKDIICPIEYAFDIFGGKWKLRIICVLAINGAMRYNAIKKELADITDTVLVSQLKEMAENEIIKRHQYNEIPPRVEYSLRSKGESAVPILKNICQWSENYAKIDGKTTVPPCKKCDRA